MARPKRAVRPVEKSLSLPQDIADRIELMLWSDLEGKVPHGAFSKFIEQAVREWFVKRTVEVIIHPKVTK